MAFASVSSLLKAPTMLEQLLEEINFQRTKEMRQLLKDGECCLLELNLCCKVEYGLYMINNSSGKVWEGARNTPSILFW
jgi:hypothetical protein